MNKIWKIIGPLLLVAVLILLARERSNQSPLQYSFQKTVGQPGGAGLNALADYYVRAGQIRGQNEITLLAVGDIMLSRNVAAKIEEAKNPLWPFSNIAGLFLTADLAFGNLESPFMPPKEGQTDSQGIIGGHSLIFGASTKYLEGLKKYNFKILNLANNHALDQGAGGLNFTVKFLNQNGVCTVGAGTDLNQAWQPAMMNLNGLNVCFLGVSYASANDGGKTNNNFVARMEDGEKLKSVIATLKSNCDFIVVSMHAGTEYVRKPNQKQIEFAHAAIDAGADLVLGHHPHWIQTIEKYNGSPPNSSCKKSSLDNPIVEKNGKKFQSLDLGYGCGGKYIFYSLGNFIFDQEWSRQTKEGLALKIKLASKRPAGLAAPRGVQAQELQGPKLQTELQNIELIPIIVENYGAPRTATETEAQTILEQIGQTQTLLPP